MYDSRGKVGAYFLFLTIGLLLGAVGGIELLRRIDKGQNTPAPLSGQPAAMSRTATASQPSAPRDEVMSSRENAIVKATKAVSPAVVGIVVTQVQLVRRAPSSDDFFDFFFDPGLMPRVKEVERMGSGFIFNNKGLILTNFHVVEGAQKLYVTFSDGRQVEGRIVGVDPQTDLAVVSAKGGDYPSVKLGESDNMLIGEWAIAIGNPFGFFINDAHPTVTLGVISAVDRNFAPSEGVYYQGMIQTDAAINQGNSGGPLVNAEGEVVGINSFIFTGSDSYRGSVGIGFAIPIDRAKRVARELIAFGKRRTVFTGVAVQDLKEGPATPASGYDKLGGVTIENIAKGSPGEAGGLRRGDIITQMGNRRIHSSADIEGLFLDYFVGDAVSVEYVRNNKARHAKIVLQEYRS